MSERTMSLADRIAFLEAKRKELRSFFENDVWTMVDVHRAEPQRVLKAHFILKWSTNTDGSPRAKARLIMQGLRDPDALVRCTPHQLTYSYTFEQGNDSLHAQRTGAFHFGHQHGVSTRKGPQQRENTLDSSRKGRKA